MRVRGGAHVNSPHEQREAARPKLDKLKNKYLQMGLKSIEIIDMNTKVLLVYSGFLVNLMEVN